MTEPITYNHPDGPEDALCCRFQGQTNLQPIHLEVRCEDRIVRVDYSSEIGNGVPMSVWHGRTLRFDLPPVSVSQARAILDDVRVRACVEGILAGYSTRWDGSNYVGILDEDANDYALTLQELTEEWEDPWDNDIPGPPHQIWRAWDWLTPDGVEVALSQILEMLEHDEIPTDDLTSDAVAEAVRGLAADGDAVLFDLDDALATLAECCHGCGYDAAFSTIATVRTPEGLRRLCDDCVYVGE